MLLCEIAGERYRLLTAQAVSIAISVEFNGAQPSHFGANVATKTPLTGEGFIGDTTQGGSCNASAISMTPHCNGTHTETVHHIVDEPVSIGNNLCQSLSACWLATLEVTPASETDDSYWTELDDQDLVITRDSVQKALPEGDLSWLESLALRTYPNPIDKRHALYNEDNPSPFFTKEAMALIAELELVHLLVDVPSVDKMYDQGVLGNHHHYWNVEQGTHQLNEQSHISRTITEMIFVDDDVSDGLYCLNLQFPDFQLDAAPSRPILYPLASAK